jgi:hypothetical protein
MKAGRLWKRLDATIEYLRKIDFAFELFEKKAIGQVDSLLGAFSKPCMLLVEVSCSLKVVGWD